MLNKNYVTSLWFPHLCELQMAVFAVLIYARFIKIQERLGQCLQSSIIIRPQPKSRTVRQVGKDSTKPHYFLIERTERCRTVFLATDFSFTQIRPGRRHIYWPDNGLHYFQLKHRLHCNSNHYDEP